MSGNLSKRSHRVAQQGAQGNVSGNITASSTTGLRKRLKSSSASSTDATKEELGNSVEPSPTAPSIFLEKGTIRFIPPPITYEGLKRLVNMQDVQRDKRNLFQQWVCHEVEQHPEYYTRYPNLVTLPTLPGNKIETTLVKELRHAMSRGKNGHTIFMQRLLDPNEGGLEYRVIRDKLPDPNPLERLDLERLMIPFYWRVWAWKYIALTTDALVYDYQNGADKILPTEDDQKSPPDFANGAQFLAFILVQYLFPAKNEVGWKPNPTETSERMGLSKE